jgi:hypothetical protein
MRWSWCELELVKGYSDLGSAPKITRGPNQKTHAKLRLVSENYGKHRISLETTDV